MKSGSATAVLDAPQAGRVRMDGRELLMLGANDYLGLANHPAVVAAVKEAVSRHGVGTGINPCFARTPVHARLESELADFLGTEAVLLFASCSAANAGVLSALAGEGDAIFSDRMNHASIIDGCRLSRADAFVYDYRSPQSLQSQLLTRFYAGKAIVVTDGVFSMEGHLAPLAQLHAATQAHGALLVIDDSHATGVVGPRGAGCAALFGIDPDSVITTGTFSKALGGAPGGFAAGSREAIERLRAQARPFIFTSGMSVADAAASLEALRQLRDHPEHLDALWNNTRSFRALLRERGFEVEDAPSPITPLPVGDAARARAIHERLLELGVFVPAMTFPIVAKDDARLRAQPSAALSPRQIEAAVDAIARAFGECAR